MREVERERTSNPLLKRQRELRGWSQARVAEELQALYPGIAVTGKMVGRWESGKRRTSSYYQEKLCVLFQTSADKLGFIPLDDSFEQNGEEGETVQKEKRPAVDWGEAPASMPFHVSSGELGTENMVQSEEREPISGRAHRSHARPEQDESFLPVEGMWFPVATSRESNATLMVS